MVFQRLHKYDVKIKANKCKLFRREVSYVGRLTSGDGYTIHPEYLRSVIARVERKTKIVSESSRLG